MLAQPCSLGGREPGPAAPTDTAAPTTPAAVLPVGEDPGDPGDDPDDRLLGLWTPLPGGPLSPRWGAQAAWTGDEAIVWGGYEGAPPDGDLDADADPRTFSPEVLAGLRPLRDGAAFDPADGTWRAIARAPTAMPAGARSVWTGEELLVLGGPAGEPLAALAYDPAGDLWRTFANVPLIGPLGEPLIWTGAEALVWGGGTGDGTRPAAALDPGTGTWRTAAAGPPLGVDVVGAWTGEEALLWDATSGSAYDPATDAWRRLDDPPAAMRTPGRLALAVGGDVLLAGAYPRLDLATYGYRYRPYNEQWNVQPLPEPPDEQFPAVSAVATGDERGVVLHRYSRGPTGGEAFRWTRASGAWERLTTNPVLERRATAEVWTGGELLVWGGLEEDGQPRPGVRPGGRSPWPALPASSTDHARVRPRELR